MSRYQYRLFQLPLGWVGLLGTDKGLRRLSFKPTPQEALEGLGTDLDHAIEAPESFSQVWRCLERYFQGEIGALDEIQLDLADAPAFFGAAWTSCRQIPPGETRSYAWLAAAAGSPLAVRAAGQAMAIAQATKYDDSLKLLNKPFSLTDLARELSALVPNGRG